MLYGTISLLLNRARVKVQMFSPPTDAVKDRIEAEVERLGAFLNNRVALEY
jgi:hypothetical protein